MSDPDWSARVGLRVIRRLIAHPLAKWSVIFMACTGVVKLGQFGLFSYIAASFPVEAFGAFGLYYAYQTAVGSFAATGIVEKATGELHTASSSAKRRALYCANSGLFLFTSAAAVALILIAASIQTGTAESSSPTAIVAAVALGLMLSYTSLQGSFLRLEGRLGASLVASSGTLLLSVLGMAMAAAAAKPVETILLAGLLGAGFGLGLLLVTKQVYFGPPSFSRFGKNCLLLLPFALIGGFGWISGYGMNTVIVRILNIESVAAFTFLLTLSSLAQLVATSLNSVWAPRFYALYATGQLGEAERKNRAFSVGQAVVLGVIGMAAVIIMPIIGEYNLNLRRYTEMRLELALLFATYVLIVPWNQCTVYYLVSGKGSQMMNNIVISGTLGLAAWFSCIVSFGSIGVYLGFFVNGLIKSALLWHNAKKSWTLASAWATCIAAAALVISASRI